MITRYLILVGRNADDLNHKLNEAERSSSLLLVWRHTNVAVLTNEGGDCLPLVSNQGIIIGSIFPKYGPSRRLSPEDLSDVDAISAGGLATLAERYWGSYVACLIEEDRVTIARDPAGGMPCYWVETDGLCAVASDAEILVTTGVLRPVIAWDEIPRYLASKDLPARHTAIEGLRELLSGTALTLGHGRSQLRSFWTPWDHVAADDPWDTASLLERLRRAVDASVGGWSTCFEAVVANISGGLDSSVVASGVARTKAKLSCVTISSDDPHGDERPFARIMAGSIGSPLSEDRYDLADVDLDSSVVGHLPKPCGRIHELAYNAALVRQVRSLGGDAVMSGNGGDNIFYNSSSVRPLLDRIRSHGLSPASVSTVRDIARVTRSTPWQVVRAAIRLAPRAGAYRWLREVEHLTPDIRHIVEAAHYGHPWMDGPANALPGKLGHIAMILRMQNHIEGYLRPFDIPVINPLTAQPIMELCLGIPTWRMIDGGIDRSPVRRTFADRLPEAIRERRTKGGPGGFAMSVIDRKSDEVRSRLLDGQLVRRGYLDRAAIEQSLKSGTAMGLGYMRLLSFLDIEAWIGRWRSLAHQSG
jgi:asparagine synthase (glutamine-hydrolysing)